jgi:copper chaperone CopZ
MASATFRAPAIHCDGCAAAIKRSLGRLAGVQAVEVAVDAKTVAVDFDAAQADRQAISSRLDAAGFPAEPVEG